MASSQIDWLRSESQIHQSTHQTRFLHNAQIFHVPPIFHHISLTIAQGNVQIWPPHLDVIGMEISVYCDGSPSDPIRETFPVQRQIDSWLWTRRTKNGKISRTRSLAVNCSKTFRIL